MSNVKQFKYLEGLNSLRFFAAFFVILSHANISLGKLGILPSQPWAFLDKGGDAVEFFFTLSGFLITYLLINEISKTGTVSIKDFYLRRVFRIWPLYFLIVAIGFVLLGVIYPTIYHKPYFEFSIAEGLLLFIFFLPNYAAKNYPVGLLNPLWSIGVEEQFYLFWAPLVKLFRKRLMPMIIGFLVVANLIYILIASMIFPIPKNILAFLLTQKFYAMATGALFGGILFYYYQAYNRSVFAKKPFQLLILGVICWHYLAGFPFSNSLVFKIIVPFLYGMLILNVSVISNKLVNLEKPRLTYLGIISYGIYMYHMVVDYLLRMVFPKLVGFGISKAILVPLYYVLITGITILIAGFSYRYFESFFLGLKKRLHSSS